MIRVTCGSGPRSSCWPFHRRRRSGRERSRSRAGNVASMAVPSGRLDLAWTIATHDSHPWAICATDQKVTNRPQGQEILPARITEHTWPTPVNVNCHKLAGKHLLTREVAQGDIYISNIDTP